MKKNVLFSILTLAVCLLSGQSVWSQGATSSSMSGRVGSDVESLPGATVVATHTPSGTTYGTTTNESGRFTIRNMRVGGPYTVRVSFVGYEERNYEGINLTLGENYVLNTTLREGVQLQAVDISAYSNEQLNSERTGASTKIGNEKVQKMPTINRGFNDFTRLTPQANIAGGAISIAGANNRFNQVTIDGAVSNDVFGLSATGTNGGQTGTSPISLDAIEEFNVEIAPYDVRLGGFGGGAISAVTRSGTNNTEGSVFFYHRNENLTGRTPGSIERINLLNDPEFERQPLDGFTDNQWGARIGGALIKDKLFYFANFERTTNVSPLAFAPGTAESVISAEDVNAIENIAREVYGYDPGNALGRQERTEESIKIFGRLDYNISDKHRLTLRHAFTRGEAVQLNRSRNFTVFSNGAILRESTTNSTVLELNSNFDNGMSNNLVAGYTSVREPRTTPGDPFPRVTVRLEGNASVALGAEAFSTVNQLDQDIFTLTNNFTLDRGKHTLTFGTHNEFYSIYNAFIGQAFGDYAFRNIDDWANGAATSFTAQYSRTDNPREGAEFMAAQFGIYAQDEFSVSERLKLTYGVRFDMPVYFDNPLTNDDFNDSFIGRDLTGQNNSDLPKPVIMPSPRIGFNWDVSGDRSTQLRGGTGLFTSRFPFVWVSGAFTQNGILLDRNQQFVNADVSVYDELGNPVLPFEPDPNNQPQRDPEAFTPGGNITIVDENFRLPQVWRTNIGIDQAFGNGFIASVDAMYSMNLNSFRFTNINQAGPVGRLNGADNRLVWASSGGDRRILPNYSEVVYVDNINEGYSWNVTAQIQKNFPFGLYASLAYSYTRSTDVFPGTSSQNQSNYYRVASVDGSNYASLANNPFDLRSRVTALVSYTKEYLQTASTTVSIFYNGQTGAPFSYVYGGRNGGDVNRSTFSGSLGNHFSLIYIPRHAGEINFVEAGGLSPEEQWNLFDAFINSDPYLRSRRGQYAERNGARAPFAHQIDVKILQDIFTDIGPNRNTLQLSLDIFNVANLINKDWGRQFNFGNSFFDNTSRLLNLEGYTDDLEPIYSFNRNAVPFGEPWETSDVPIGGSRWVAMVGVRYLFN